MNHLLPKEEIEIGYFYIVMPATVTKNMITHSVIFFTKANFWKYLI